MLERTIPKMVEIRLALDEDLATIHADPTQIDQVLMNLAVNARDAMPKGGKLTFETSNVLLDEKYARMHVDAVPGRHILLIVSDTGSGIAKEALERIFEPFYTTKDAGDGTGLGLAMVHGIVKQHGGHVTCHSELGQGTTFRIYLPAGTSSEDVEPRRVSTMSEGGSETILLADDEELIRDLGSRILTQAGYRVITAANGRETLEIYRDRREEISLVILNVIMPEMGGAECLPELIRINPDLKTLIASGFSTNGAVSDILQSGARGFVKKPFNLNEMLHTVRKVLDGD